MRTRSKLFALCITTALAACSVTAVTFNLGDGPLAEDCTMAGDEDGNSMADCSDPACAGVPACQPACGNGKVDPDEGCDDGNSIDGDGCDNNCMVTGCGNGIQTGTEGCDDGNLTSGDGCDNNCTVTACGNGMMTAGEQCDDGNGINGDACENNCTLPVCGNGIKDVGEQCDDGNGTNGDGCDSCRVAPCTTNLVPTMTSPTSPSGLVSRSGAIDASNEAWQAFDASTSSMWISATFETPAWIAYQWGDGPRNVTSYAITFTNGSSLTTRAPRDWTFEGWDGSSWNVIDTRSAQTGWLGVERRAYTVGFPSSYGMYRLNISDDNDTRAGVVAVSMGRLELMGCPP